MRTEKINVFILSLCFLIAALFPSYTGAQEAESTPGGDTSPDKVPHLAIDAATFDVGAVYEGQTVVHAFTVKNTGTAELSIKDVKAGWGCTVANFDKAILPGQEGKVTLTVNTTNRRGTLKQSATILSNDPENPSTQITITGSLKHYISVTPGVQIQLRGFAGDTPAKTVTITSEEEQPLEILETSSTLEDTIAYKLTTIEQGKSYSLEVSTPSGLKESFRGNIRLKTNSQKKPTIELTIIGLVQKEITAAPQYLYFGVIDTSIKSSDQKRLTRTVEVSRAKGNAFTIEKVASNPDHIKTEVVPGPNGENHSVAITLLTDNLQKGVLKEEIKVHTKYNTASEIITVFVEAKIN